MTGCHVRWTCQNTNEIPLICSVSYLRLTILTFLRFGQTQCILGGDILANNLSLRVYQYAVGYKCDFMCSPVFVAVLCRACVSVVRSRLPNSKHHSIIWRTRPFLFLPLCDLAEIQGYSTQHNQSQRGSDPAKENTTIVNQGPMGHRTKLITRNFLCLPECWGVKTLESTDTFPLQCQALLVRISTQIRFCIPRSSYSGGFFRCFVWCNIQIKPKAEKW